MSCFNSSVGFNQSLYCQRKGVNSRLTKAILVIHNSKNLLLKYEFSFQPLIDCVVFQVRKLHHDKSIQDINFQERFNQEEINQDQDRSTPVTLLKIVLST
jgi:hypothetical protein